MEKEMRNWWRLGLMLALAAAISLGGCTTTKKWLGMQPEDKDEDIPPEARQETMLVDGKTYVRSRNPYYLTYPEQPEYIYVEKGKEFVGAQEYMMRSLAKAIGREKAKSQAKAPPPDQIQELVRQEVARVLGEKGPAGLAAKTGADNPYTGRTVAVIPVLKETPRGYEGMNRTLAVSLAENLQRQKGISVASEDQVKAAMGKAGITGKLESRNNIKTLGDYLGVQGVILTRVVPEGSSGFMVLEVYDTYQGNKVRALVEPAKGPLKPEGVTQFARQNALLVSMELVNLEWFGRVEFVKDGRVYLSLGNNAGLKVGDRLRVVAPGKEVVNPSTHASLGYSSDTPEGEVKVVELLGTTGAVAQGVSGGPFKPNEKVKARK